jgi:chromosome segregation ATPase
MPPNDKVTNEQLDRVLKHMERHTDTLSTMLAKNNDATEQIGKQVTLMEAQLNDAREYIASLDCLIRGNGQMGLKTKTELLDKRTETLEKRISSIGSLAKEDKQENNKRKTAIHVAVITGSIGGLIACIKIIVGLFV